NTKYLILELSSWHLESLAEHKLSPHIALITNIMPDHLNRYKNFADYKRAKTFIFKHQTANDVLFLNKHDSVSRQIGQRKNIKSKILWYVEKEVKDLKFAGDFKSCHPDNLQGVLAISQYLSLNKKTVQQAIKTFPGLEGRLEFVDIIDGVKYYNDTCATQPEATIYAIRKLKTQSSKLKANVNIILIAGGEDKNLNYDKLARAIAENVKTLILFKGSASDKIVKALKQFNNGTIEQLNNIYSMQEAVNIAQGEAKPNDIVLLSPAAASFGLFKHEFDRGKQFKICVKKIKNRTTQTIN
ncbi:MAG: UDP-N-acetylmuramoyl-L-alanine--D-glutamate ligase, partial [Patescibacteria group bacterium]